MNINGGEGGKCRMSVDSKKSKLRPNFKLKHLKWSSTAKRNIRMANSA